ncbi:esterase [Intrasporangium oryzae NRRL B-24470]|uniref:Esterase n=1 Tax=Intrasporangium oryzae NRRL B-24470 TaxID=1386089 RepID=W9G7Y7_9MICO|nr:alpha/beta fold hydrolase [Intrasporangium oryzae]EWS99978.1 esterase [Intrasporangium oryzae NRRL B-24470]
MPVHPEAVPIFHEGDRTAVLLVHGFTGSPKSLRPWAEDLHARGHTVSVPRLPGHGTHWREMNRTTWAEWYAEAERELERLRDRSDHVVVGGLSMGGAIALRLAELRGDLVDGIVLVNPVVGIDDVRLRALPVLKHVVAGFPGISNDIKKPGQDECAYDRVPLKALHSQVGGWAEVVADLGRVHQPLLLFRSRVDHVVPASSSARVLERVSSADTTEVVLEDSFHVATLDNDAPAIFAETADFLRRITKESE